MPLDGELKKVIRRAEKTSRTQRPKTFTSSETLWCVVIAVARWRDVSNQRRANICTTARTKRGFGRKKARAQRTISVEQDVDSTER